MNWSLRAVLMLGLTAGLFTGLFADTTSMAGDYRGEWNSSDGSGGGKVTIKLEQKADSTWTGSYRFTYQGDDIVTVTQSVKVEGERVEIVCDYEIDGAKLRSKLNGILKGKTVEGKYESYSLEGGILLSEGTWKVAQS